MYKKSTLLLGALALLTTTLACAQAPSAAKLLEVHKLYNGAGKCGPDEVGTIVEVQVIPSREAERLFGNAGMAVKPNGLYVMTVAQMGKEAVDAGSPGAITQLQEVAAGAKVVDFKELIGTEGCYPIGDY